MPPGSRALAAHPDREAALWTTRAQEALPGIIVAGVVGFLAVFGWLCLETIANGKALVRIEAKLDAIVDRLPPAQR